MGLGIETMREGTLCAIYSQYFQLQQSLEGVLVHAGDLVIVQL